MVCFAVGNSFGRIRYGLELRLGYKNPWHGKFSSMTSERGHLKNFSNICYTGIGCILHNCSIRMWFYHPIYRYDEMVIFHK